MKTLNVLPAVLAVFALSHLFVRAVPGDVTPDFAPNPDGFVWTTAIEPDGQVLVGGEFSQIADMAWPRLARLNPDGSADAAFSPPLFFGEAVHAIAVMPDGQLLVAGDFIVMQGEVVRQYLIRLHPDGSLDEDFDLPLDGAVSALAVQADGQIVIAGEFTNVGNGYRPKIARILASGALDADYLAVQIDGAIHAMVLQPDGKLLIGGEFTTVSSLPRNRLARLNINGVPDVSFNPGVDGAVESLAIQPDGRILVGGAFGQIAGTSRDFFARLHADGTFDAGFAAAVDGAVSSMALQADGRIVAGGWFWNAGGMARLGLARFASDGSVDPGFFPNPNLPVLSVSLRADGRIVAGGVFSNIGGQARANLALLDNNPATSQLDAFAGMRIEWLRGGSGPEVTRVEFSASPDDGGTWQPLGDATRIEGGWEMNGAALTGGGTLRARGFIHDGSWRNGTGIIEAFSTYQVHTVTFDLAGKAMHLGGELVQSVVEGSAADAPEILALSGWVFVGWDVEFSEVRSDLVVTALYSRAPGYPELDFAPQPSSPVYGVAMQPDGKWIAAGMFTMLAGETRSRIARFHADGTLDPDFAPLVNGVVYAVLVQADGGIVIGGDFSMIGSTPRSRIARLMPDGSVDPDFNPGAANPNEASSVTALALQRDGKILIGGSFTLVGSYTRNRIARLHPDGSVDSSFNPNASAPVYCILTQPDGRILLGGLFTTLGGQSRPRIARIMADGSLDPSFNPGADAAVYAMALDGVGGIWVGGEFTQLAGQARTRIGRFDASGTLDATFSPNVLDNAIYGFTRQANGEVLVGGSFTRIDGRARGGIARLRVDGSLDWDFNPMSSGVIYSMALQPDGRVLVGGGFSQIGSADLRYLARLANNPAIFELQLQLGEGRARMVCDGTAPEFSRVTYELTPDDGASWLPLGDGVRVTDGWEITGLQLAGDGAIRATGFVQDASFTSASGSIHASENFALGGDFFTVTFDLAGKATRTGGGALMQRIAASGAAIAPVIEPISGWAFSGWDASFDEVNADLTVTAQYAAFGTSDPNFAGVANNTVLATAAQPDGKILVAGSFNTLAGVSRIGIGRLLADGTIDAGFNAASNSTVNTMAVQPDGKILVGGAFTLMGGVARNYLARLHPDGTLDSTFNPGVSGGPVFSVALQDDGAVLIGGAFTSVAGVGRNRIARLHATGALDTSFNPSAYNSVYAIALQPDGKIVIGGAFTQVGSYGRSRIARLFSNGAVDTAFSPSAFHPSGDSAVYAIAVQPDGNIVFGGNFSVVNSTYRYFLARVSSAGVLDGSFYPNANGNVYALALQADGGILVGGYFGTISGNPNYPGIARLSQTGSLDLGFRPAPNSTVNSITLQPDGRVIVGGGFSYIGGQTRSYLARLWNAPAPSALAMSSPDRIQWLRGGTAPEVGRVAFEVSVNDGETWHWIGDGARIAGGWEIDGVQLAGHGQIRARGFIRDGSFQCGSGIVETQMDFHVSDEFHIVEFDLGAYGTRTGGGAIFQIVSPGGSAVAPTIQTATGWIFDSWDTSFVDIDSDRTITAQYQSSPGNVEWGFNPNIGGQVYTTAIQPDGKILVGGSFSTVGGQSRPHLCRLDPDGSLDSTFDPGFISAPVHALALLPDGKVLVGGQFTSIGGQTRYRIVRLNANGALDSTFSCYANNTVFTILPQVDGKILVGGSFDQLGSYSRSRIGRIHANGAIDTDFNPAANGAVNAFALQSDGRIIVGGSFGVIGGVSRGNIARLSASGAVDMTFGAYATGPVYAFAVQPDDRILIGGLFTGVSGQTRNRLARLNADGTLDSSFNSSLDNVVYAIALQSDGKVLAGGDFLNTAGQTRYRVVRLHSNGAVDTAFINSNVIGGAVYSLSLQADGCVLLGGAFTSVGGQSRNGIARLSNGPATQELTVTSASRIEWLRGGTAPEATRVTFDHSTDGNDPWTALGEGIRIEGGWEMNDLDLAGTIHIRATAHANDGSCYAGSGIHQKTTAVSFHTVTFDLAGRCEHVGGGALTQSILPGHDAVAPLVDPITGWEFLAWDGSYHAVSQDLTITARFQPVAGSFYAWLAGQGLDGDPATHFAEIDPTYGVPRGLVFAFGENLHPGEPALRILLHNGVPVLEMPKQPESTQVYVNLAIVGSDTLAPDTWNLAIIPAEDVTGKPDRCLWFQPEGDPPTRAFFRIRFDLIR